jgi:hypothetical protein
MSNPFLLSAITDRERNSVTTIVFDCISNLGGWVNDVRMYSNIMTNVSFTLAENKIQPFLDALATNDLHARLERDDKNISSSPRAIERNGSIQITFVHNEPDLKRHVPAVPGY